MNPSSRLINRICVLLLGVLSCAYFAQALTTGRTQALDGDEVFTMWIVRDSPSVMGALKAGADTAPPAFYFLLRGVCHALGYTPLAVRLPAIVGFFLFLLTLFLLIRRFAGTAIAAAAVTFPLFSSAFGAAILARPYALVMACFGGICLLWCGDEGSRKIWRAVTIAVLLSFASLMHFYGVLLIPLFLAMEGVWTLRHRAVRWRYWVAGVAGGLGMVVSLPVILPIFKATHDSAKASGYYAKPEMRSLLDFVERIGFGWRMEELYLWALLLGCAVEGYRIYRRREPSPAKEYGDSLGAAAFAALLYPFVTFVFALLVTRVFNERYMFGAVLGVSVGFALLVRRLEWPALPALLLLLLSCALYGKIAMAAVRSPGDGRPAESDLIASVPEGYPVLITSGAAFFVYEESKEEAVRSRATYMLPPPGMHNPNPEPERLALAWKSLRPELNVVTSEELLARHATFYILCNTEDHTETVTAWAVEHFHVTVVRYTATRMLLEVTH